MADEPPELPVPERRADSLAATSKSLKSPAVLAAAPALDTDVEHPRRAAVEALLDRADPAGPDDPHQAGLAQHLTWWATVLFGRPSASASSVTVAARSWSRPRIVVRKGWLIALTWVGS